MDSVIGAVLLLGVAVMEVLLIFGLPLGEFTMGGRYKVLPPMFRLFAASSIILQLFGAAMLLVMTLVFFLQKSLELSEFLFIFAPNEIKNKIQQI